MDQEQNGKKDERMDTRQEMKPEAKQGRKQNGKKDLVTFRLFKDDGKYKDPIFVGVNGKSYLVQRGVDVEMPRGVYNALINAKEQIQTAMEYSEKNKNKLDE